MLHRGRCCTVAGAIELRRCSGVTPVSLIPESTPRISKENRIFPSISISISISMSIKYFSLFPCRYSVFSSFLLMSVRMYCICHGWKEHPSTRRHPAYCSRLCYTTFAPHMPSCQVQRTYLVCLNKRWFLQFCLKNDYSLV